MNSAPSAPATMTCPKCLGTKRFQAFAHIEGGKCFFCKGAGTIEVSDRLARALPKRTPAEQRAALINRLANVIAAARSHYETRGEWLFLDLAEDVEQIGYIRHDLANAPADVAERARKALALAIKDEKVRAAVLA